MSTKTLTKPYRGENRGQKRVRKFDDAMPESLDVQALKINLGDLVGSLNFQKKTEAYAQIAMQMSALAGLHNGHSWTWRYVASFHSGTIEPSEKFLHALVLLLEKLKPNKKQWFYFAYRHEVAAIFGRCIRREMIMEHMRELKFKPVTFSRYMQIKGKATHRRTS